MSKELSIPREQETTIVKSGFLDQDTAAAYASAQCDGDRLLRSESTLQKGLCNFSAFPWKKPVLERMKT